MKNSLSNLKDFFTDHFLDVWIGFLLGCFLAVLLSLIQSSQPTRAEESGSLNFNSVDYQFSVLSYGAWNDVYTLNNAGTDNEVVFDADFTHIDRVTQNCRLRIFYEVRRESSLDYFRTDLEYILQDYFYFGIDDYELFSNNITLNLYSVTINQGTYLTPILQDISISSSGYPDYILRFSPIVDSEVICVEALFNFHVVTNDLQEARYQCYIGTGYPTLTYTDYYPSITPPDFSDIENDAFSGLDTLEQYLGGMPLKDVGLGKVLYTVMNNSYILLTMCIFLSVGIIGFVLYGKR